MRLYKSITVDRVLELVELSMTDTEFNGICTICGEEQGGVDPDAERVKCEECGHPEVFGAEALLLMMEV